MKVAFALSLKTLVRHCAYAGLLSLKNNSAAIAGNTMRNIPPPL
jgi:hypothetical protein